MQPDAKFRTLFSATMAICAVSCSQEIQPNSQDAVCRNFQGAESEMSFLVSNVGTGSIRLTDYSCGSEAQVGVRLMSAQARSVFREMLDDLDQSCQIYGSVRILFRGALVRDQGNDYLDVQKIGSYEYEPISRLADHLGVNEDQLIDGSLIFSENCDTAADARPVSDL